MTLTTDDFVAFMVDDPEDDENSSLGDALSEIAVDAEVDAVNAVRKTRER